ncbi:hypothetical protein C8J57DRAFT_1344205 [Mycena rebaudengoi]|nr:hypothetical protein C8J57DRAFT_1344205 [Mycena rebaudengoi]
MQGLRALRQLALRPPIPTLHHPMVYGALSTLPQSTVPATPDVCDGVVKNPCLNFYRTKINLGPFSCDWEKFLAWRFFAVSSDWHDLTEMDFFVKRLFKIPGTIRPLAFLDYYEPCIVFEAGGEYCYLDTGSNDYLIHYGHAFASEDDFLAAFIHRHPPLEGTIHEFPDDTEDLYDAVWDEQKQRKKEAAEKARQN